MIDFFDEDFPLTKKQEEMLAQQKKLEEEKKAREEAEKAEKAAELAATTEESTASKEVPTEVLTETAEPENEPAEPVEEAPEIAEPVEEVAEVPVVQEASEEVTPSEDLPVVDEAPVEEESEAEIEAEPVIEFVPTAIEPTAMEEDTDETEPEIEAMPESEPEAEAEPEIIPEEVSEPETETVVAPVEEYVPDVNISFSDESIDDVVVPEEIAIDETETVQEEASAEPDNSLRDEIQRLLKKLDSMEKAVDSLGQVKAASEVLSPVAPMPAEDESENEAGFNYEYDDRYFAEEETPAYKYPELYKKPQKTTVKKVVRKPKENDHTVSINTRTLLQVGAIVAATAAAVKLLDRKDND